MIYHLDGAAALLHRPLGSQRYQHSCIPLDLQVFREDQIAGRLGSLSMTTAVVRVVFKFNRRLQAHHLALRKYSIYRASGTAF